MGMVGKAGGAAGEVGDEFVLGDVDADVDRGRDSGMVFMSVRSFMLAMRTRRREPVVQVTVRTGERKRPAAVPTTNGL
jgi:hypothetical protein